MSADVSRTIVLTGVTRGLGRALVDRFVEGGHIVIGCGRSAEVIEEPTASDHCPLLIELELLPLVGGPWGEVPGQ